MKRSNIIPRRFCCCAVLVIAFSGFGNGQVVKREQWGAPDVVVSNSGRKWSIAGKKNKVMLDGSNLALKVNVGSEVWQMAPSSLDDMTVGSGGHDIKLRLADASSIAIVPYDTGFKKGVKISLSNWKGTGKPLDLGLTLTVC